MTISPGTTISDLTLTCLPFLNTLASSGEYSDNAYISAHLQTFQCTAIAFSAPLSCDTPTIALRTRIVRITIGSTNAVKSSPSSINANANEITAEPSNINTN